MEEITNMKKKLLIVILVAGLLLMLFSCGRHEKSDKFVEDNTSIRKMQGYELLDSWDSSTGIAIHIVVTDVDTVVLKNVLIKLMVVRDLIYLN